MCFHKMPPSPGFEPRFVTLHISQVRQSGIGLVWICRFKNYCGSPPQFQCFLSNLKSFGFPGAVQMKLSCSVLRTQQDLTSKIAGRHLEQVIDVINQNFWDCLGSSAVNISIRDFGDLQYRISLLSYPNFWDCMACFYCIHQTFRDDVCMGLFI